jgi:hypothetical protein
MSARPNRLKRGFIWSGVTLGLLVLYLASCPFVMFWSERYLPAATFPVVRAGYAPLEAYCREEWPGSGFYGQYAGRCLRALNEHARGDASAALEEQTSVQFVQTPLRDVISYVSELHNFHIELLDGVDGDVEVTANSKATVREVLDEMLHPLGLAVAPVGRNLVIGSPEVVQGLVAEAAAAEAGKLRGNLIVLGVLVLLVTVIVLLWRRRVARRRDATRADGATVS